MNYNPTANHLFVISSALRIKWYCSSSTEYNLNFISLFTWNTEQIHVVTFYMWSFNCVNKLTHIQQCGIHMIINPDKYHLFVITQIIIHNTCYWLCEWLQDMFAECQHTFTKLHCSHFSAFCVNKPINSTVLHMFQNSELNSSKRFWSFE